MNYINREKIILASKSPRRKILLEQIGINIEILPSDIDEKKVSVKNPVAYAQELAELKAGSVAASYPDKWIIGADTIVVLQNKIMGKPESKAEAISMLNSLNNREHDVITAFCICNHKKGFMVTESITTRVYFKNMEREEINWYADTHEPFDKAGGYGIQGIGSFIVKKITGSYSNVVGLPVCEVVEALKKLNLIKLGT